MQKGTVPPDATSGWDSPYTLTTFLSRQGRGRMRNKFKFKRGKKIEE